MELARLREGKACAPHVVDTRGYPSGRGNPKWTSSLEEQLKTFGLEITATVEETTKAAGIEVEFVTLEGQPAEKILDFTEKNAVNMIVVG